MDVTRSVQGLQGNAAACGGCLKLFKHTCSIYSREDDVNFIVLHKMFAALLLTRVSIEHLCTMEAFSKSFSPVVKVQIDVFK